MVVMSIGDVLTMNFFWMVRDEGSWLDIGTSISHFVIASLLCVFVAGLEFVSEVFVSGVEVGGEVGMVDTVEREAEGVGNGGREVKNKFDGKGKGKKVGNGVAKE